MFPRCVGQSEAVIAQPREPWGSLGTACTSAVCFPTVALQANKVVWLVMTTQTASSLQKAMSLDGIRDFRDDLFDGARVFSFDGVRSLLMVQIRLV